MPEPGSPCRQRNKLSGDAVTYYFNYDLKIGSSEVLDDSGSLIRAATEGAGTLGFIVKPRPDTGFVRYLPCEIVRPAKG